MSKVNCIVPVRVVVRGDPQYLDLDALTNTVAAAVESRLVFAREQIASGSGAGEWPTLLHEPTVTFLSESIDEETRSAMEQAIREAIDRSRHRHGITYPSSPFLFADLHPGQGISLIKTGGGPSAAPAKSKPRSTLKIAAGQEKAFWDALRKNVLSRDSAHPEISKEAAEVLVLLTDQEEARKILRAGLQVTIFESAVRITILEGLYALSQKDDDIWDLILSGVGIKNDSLAEYKFLQWLKQHGGRQTVEYLDRKLSGPMGELQGKAAKVVLYLLQLEFDPEAKKLSTEFTLLKKMAAKHNLWTGGALGSESLRQLNNSQIAALNDLVEELYHVIEASPYQDGYDKVDLAALIAFREALNVKLGLIPGLDVDALENLDIRLAQGTQAASIIIERSRILRENAVTLIRYIGGGAGETDEVRTLFLIRHRYVMVLTNLLTDGNFSRSIIDVDLLYVDFPSAVITVKQNRVRELFGKIAVQVLQAKQIQPVTLSASDQAYLDMAAAIERMKITSFQLLYTESFALVVRAETEVNLMGLQAAIFILYALALRMTNDLKGSSIGSENFRNEQIKKLGTIRVELLGYFNKSDYKGFSDRAEVLRKSISDVADAISHEAKVDVAIHLLITAVATLLTFGAAAIARLAILGETLAVIRTAESASAVVLLVEAGTFTIAELAGEKLAFDKPITLSGAAQSFLSNAAFFGLFRIIGSFTAPLARGRVLLGFIAPHLANLAVTTGISALATRLQTGQWPSDIGQFLLVSLVSYAVIASISAATLKLSKPSIDARVKSMLEVIDRENIALYQRYQQVIDSGSLTEPEFESMRKRKLNLHTSVRELAKFLNQEGLMTDEQRGGIEENLKAMDDVAKGAKFVSPEPALVGRDGGRLIRALPTPENITGFTRLGQSNIFRFDPSHPPDVSSMLVRFEANGYRIQRYSGGVIRVLTGGGRTVLLLEPGPPIPALNLLTSHASAGPIKPHPITLLEKVTYTFVPEELAPITADLKVINPNLIPTLEGEFNESVALAALGLFVEQRGNLKSFWPVASVRGLAKMLQLERGITRATVRRLFIGRSSEALADLFGKFNRIADWPGANLLVDAEFDPSRSVKLIDVYDAMGHLRPPDGMSWRAVRGLLRWAEEAATPADAVQKLRDIAPDKRLARLEADSPIQDPNLRAPSHVDEVMRAQSQDIRPGLNLLAGKLADAIQAVDTFAQAHSGSFSEPAVRQIFEQEVRKYRDLAANFQAGSNVERNLVGARNEIAGIIYALERGESVFALGPTRIHVDPRGYPISRGILVNWPKDITVQFDAATQKVDGRLVTVETTTGKLSLPGYLKFLDPASGLPPGNFDYRQVNTRDASERKWVQIVKMRAAALFARDLANAFGATATLPDLVFRAETTEDARRALVEMGFTVAP